MAGSKALPRPVEWRAKPQRMERLAAWGAADGFHPAPETPCPRGAKGLRQPRLLRNRRSLGLRAPSARASPGPLARNRSSPASAIATAKRPAPRARRSAAASSVERSTLPWTRTRRETARQESAPRHSQLPPPDRREQAPLKRHRARRRAWPGRLRRSDCKPDTGSVAWRPRPGSAKRPRSPDRAIRLRQRRSRYVLGTLR